MTLELFVAGAVKRLWDASAPAPVIGVVVSLQYKFPLLCEKLTDIFCSKLVKGLPCKVSWELTFIVDVSKGTRF